MVKLVQAGWRPPPLTDEQAQRLLDDMEHAQRNSTLALAEKEIRTLRLLADGRTLDEAAAEAGLSRETIKTQSSSCVAKLGARNITHAVAIAIREGVIA